MRAALLCTLPLCAILGCMPEPAAEPMPANPPAPRTVLVIHGGAGVMSEARMKADGLTRQDYEKVMTQALKAGYDTLKTKGKTSTHAVEATIRVLEDSDLFNAGRGGVFDADGRVSLDASIMEGKMEGSGEGKRDPRKRAGAVGAVTHIRNPISAARAIMEMDGSANVLLIGEGAEQYALSEPIRAKYNLERVSNIDFWTERRLKEIQKQHDRGVKEPTRRGDAGLPPEMKFGTVGAVALDANNNITAGTSTGGLTNKRPGRLGDSPIIGAGTYADDRACGVSCTGTGEVFIRHAVAHDIVARMLYAKLSVADAVRDTMANLPDEDGGVGGLIALDATGRHAFGMSKKCDGMYRGYVTDDGTIHLGIFSTDEMKAVK